MRLYLAANEVQNKGSRAEQAYAPSMNTILRVFFYFVKLKGPVRCKITESG